VWWKVCVTKKQIFLPKNVWGGLELPISRLLDQTVTNRPPPLNKTDGQYTYIQWYWSHHIYLQKSIGVRRCHGLTVAKRARIHSANASVGSVMMETETSFHARQHGKNKRFRTNFILLNTNFIWLHTNLCDNQSHKYFGWFFVRFPWITHKH
jgi:hypothetical protein